MNAKKVSLIHASTGNVAEAMLHEGLTVRDLVLVERAWVEHRARIVAALLSQRVPRARWPQSLHWDWSKKAPDLASLAVTGTGIAYDNDWQAVMMTKTQPYVTQLLPDRGKPLVYLDYIEAAPWNWPIKELGVHGRPRFKGCGTLLFREAVLQSVREEFQGRLGLHALHQAEQFYEQLGMTKLGPDIKKQNLTYFEFTREQAKHFLYGGQP